MSSVLCARHAETDMTGTFCGHSDPPLNASGRRQAEELAASLSGESFDAIYSSPLRRAAQTAELLGGVLRTPVSPTPGLAEIHFGEWEGLTWQEIEQRDPGYARRWMQDFPALAAPGGEPFPAFEERVLQQLDRFRVLAEDQRLLVVTHGGVLRVILQRVLGCSADEAWQRTRSCCGFFECDLQGDLQKVER